MKFMEVDDKHKVHKGITTIPTRGTSQSAGYDFHLKEDVMLDPQTSQLTFTDVKCQLSPNEVLHIYPRSSISIKRGVVLTNTVGVIDADYFENEDNDGNIGISLYNTNDKTVFLKKGERIAQGVVTNFVVAEDDEVVQTRNGGIGSTGI